MKVTKDRVVDYIFSSVYLDDQELFSGKSSPTRIWTQIGGDAEGGSLPAVDIEVFDDRVVVIGEVDTEFPFPKTMKELKKLSDDINAKLKEEYDGWEYVGVVQKMKYFVFVDDTDSPYEVRAIFSNLFDAKRFAEQDVYMCVRKANWTDGEFPAYSQTKTVE